MLEDPSQVAHPLIPAIIHQTWKDENIPAKWRGAQQSCRELHPSYKYLLWTDAMARSLIADKHPALLPTYDAYPYSIERADVIRWGPMQGASLVLCLLCTVSSNTRHQTCQSSSGAAVRVFQATTTLFRN